MYETFKRLLRHDAIMTHFFMKGSSFMDFYATIFSLLPPIIAIALALITKEVYSSLFIGIFVGGLLFTNINLVGTLEQILVDGRVRSPLSTPSSPPSPPALSSVRSPTGMGSAAPSWRI